MARHATGERPLRVWHVIHTLGDGGADRALSRLVCHSDPRKFRQGIVVLEPGPGHCPLPPDVRVRTAGDGRSLPSALAALRSLGPAPDVVHGWVSFPSVVAAAYSAATGTPLVLRQPTNIEAELRWNRGGVGAIWRELRAAFAMADAVVVPSPVLEAGTRRVYDVGRVVAIPNAIEPEAPSRWASHSPGRDRRFVVALVGRLVEQKNPMLLLDALARIADVDWELRVYGDGGLRGPMEAFIRSHRLDSRVVFMGFRADWRADAAAYGAFVLPARFEGMSNTLLEAAAAGLPIVTTSIPENRFLLRDGEALFVEPDDAAGLAAAIRRIAREPGLAVALSGAATHAPLRFAVPAMVRAHESLYEELAAAGPRRRAA